jgi:predicted ATPase
MDERMFEAELHRIIGDALLSMQRQGGAELEFTRALAVARQQQAESWELRAAMSLARLWRDQGMVQQPRRDPRVSKLDTFYQGASRRGRRRMKC